jgi:ABC-type antimicrobial peptide transport system permease subunit
MRNILFPHYQKIAFRNLWKYRSQTLISVIGLAVGFTCFTLAVLWIRYEMTYDGFHRNADRIYCINVPDVRSINGVSKITPRGLANYLKQTFPEIGCATTVIPTKPGVTVEYDDVEIPANYVSIDSSFLGLFDIGIVEGSMDFLIPGSKNIAVTREKSLQLFGNESPVGKIVKFPQYAHRKYTICAVVSGLSGHSNYTFDFLFKEGGIGYTLIELMKGVDIDAFRKKLYAHEYIDDGKTVIREMTVTPLTALRYEDPYQPRNVKFGHIIIFAVAGLLLVLCTLFNYLTLFICRLRIRERELALRRIYGSSVKSLFALLSVEFAHILIVACLLGVFLIYWVFPSFQILSEVKMGLYDIYFEYCIYTGGIIFISLAIFLLIFCWRRLHFAVGRNNKKLFRKTSVTVQIIISLGFIFCTAVIIKQMYYLRHTDLGFSFKNRGAIVLDSMIDVFYNQINQIPEITETAVAPTPLLPVIHSNRMDVSIWDGKPDSEKTVHMEGLSISERFISFYELELLDGEILSERDDSKYVLINEAAAKVFNWHNPVGKSFDKYTVKGVIKDIYNFTPTIPAEPFYYMLNTDNKENVTLLFKYREGTWQTCRDKIVQIIKKIHPKINPSRIFESMFSADKEYDNLLKSENALLKILTFISIVCVIIGIFGFVSIVLLTCEERRKEIAVRKVNGATVKDILDLFFREYFLLFFIGASIAFSVGYYIMRIWLEQYIRQTAISAWIYLSIVVFLMLAVIFCVGKKVYEASIENPSEVLKKE